MTTVAVAPVAVAEPPALPLAGLRALLVGKPSHTQKLLRQTVERLGCDEVTEAATAEDAVLTLELSPVHLVICDAQLDGARDGDQLLEELRMRNLLPPVAIFVLVSSERAQRKVTSYAELGPDAYLVKPIERDDVVRRLARLVARRRLLREVFVALDDDDTGRAASAARSVAASHPAVAAEAARRVADRLIAEQRLDEAEALVRELMTPDEPHWALLRLARVRYLQGKLPDSHRILERLIARAPDLLAAYDLMAMVEEQMGRLDQALARVDAAAERSAFNLGRLRLSGELAVRAGDLARAEREFGRVMERLRSAGLETASDFGNMISVLVARGKLDAAAALQAEQARSRRDDPDTQLMQPLVEVARARDAGDRQRLDVWLDLLVEMLQSGGADASSSLQLAALEAVFDNGRSDDGFRLAQSMIRTFRADRAALHRLRSLIDRRQRQPKNLLDLQRIQLELDRFELEGWDHAAATPLFESLEHWSSQRPCPDAVPSLRARLADLARRNGISAPDNGILPPV